MKPTVGGTNARGRLRLVPTDAGPDWSPGSGQEPGQGAQEWWERRSNPECLCGCGEPVQKGRLFCQGHSIRMVELAKRYVRGEVRPDEEQMRYLETSGKLDAARVRVQVEDSSSRGRRPSEGMRVERAEPRMVPRVI